MPSPLWILLSMSIIDVLCSSVLKRRMEGREEAKKMTLYKIKILCDLEHFLDPLVACLVSQAFGTYEYWYRRVEDGYILYVYTDQAPVNRFVDAVIKHPRLDTPIFVFKCDD